VIDVKEIKDLAHEFGIEVRITSAEPFVDAANRITTQVQEGLFLNTRYWQPDDIKKFCDVRSILPQAKSIICAFLCYLTDEGLNNPLPCPPYGLVARYTWRNYYDELKKRLNKICQFLKKKYSAKSCCYSNGPIAEKPIAIRSGIGYYGKHSIVMNKTYGSWIVLGEIITDIELSPDKPVNQDCGTCKKCIYACPTKAIIRPYVIDRRRCIQALTNWLGVIPGDIANIWENRVYGCTTCQDICPINQKVKPQKPQAEIGVVGPYLPILEILEMDEITYRKKYAKNQITANWINFVAIKRNCLVALGNIGDKAALPILKKFFKGNNPLLSETAKWAIRRISSGSN